MLSVTASYPVCVLNSSNVVNERIDGVYTLDEGDCECDSIVALTDRAVTVTSKALGEKLELEGILSVNVIYYCEDSGELSRKSVDLPFMLAIKLPIADGEVGVCVDVASLSIKCRRGSEFDIKADVSIRINAKKCEEVALMTELAEGEEYERCDNGFSVYVGSKGETLWEVARVLRCSPDEITDQNELSFPLAGGERVVLYRKLNQEG